jgi:laminin gamma 1
MDCEGYRDGQHCERCLPNHFFSPIKDEMGRIPCEPCNCDPTGSKSLQCSPDGQCDCKPGVTGPKCDQCEVNHWNFGSLGCETCGCMAEGSRDNTPSCNPVDGDCFCKQNAEGQRCDRCKAGHFHIDEDNDFGCTPCFCYGHTSECELSGGYVKTVIDSDFSRSDEKWKAFEDERLQPVKYDVINKYIGIQSDPDPNAVIPYGAAFFLAPEEYLGDMRASYNQDIMFKLRVNDEGPTPGAEDVIIVGGGAKTTKISLSITEQNNSVPAFEMQTYTFRLHENPEFGWSPRLSAKDFMAVLANITAIKIRGSYVAQGIGFLDNINLGSASRGQSGEQATWIERCQCPQGYQGQFCQLCVAGYHHENNGGPFARCIPCSCNNHADICDAESGKCDCQHNTDGHNCDQCAKGFYGNALTGTPNDCEACPCPDGGACVEIPGSNESPFCTECPSGRTGSRCEKCEDGYYGDPMGQNGPVRPCQKCQCNKNVDSNAIGNCDSLTGECLRCIDNTDGFNCERCKSGFFGDALALKKPGDPPSCQPCQCYPVGTNLNDDTYLPICNGFTGDCSCKPHVVGRDCDKCADGYFNIDSGQGCEPCNCDATGSQNATCHVLTGQCFCNPGVTGQRCESCLPKHYGFSSDGCKECDCDPTGSTDLQCDLVNGQCPCRVKRLEIVESEADEGQSFACDLCLYWPVAVLLSTL